MRKAAAGPTASKHSTTVYIHIPVVDKNLAYRQVVPSRCVIVVVKIDLLEMRLTGEGNKRRIYKQKPYSTLFYALKLSH